MMGRLSLAKAAVSISLLLACAGPGWAADKTWTGTNGTDFTDTLNWNPSVPANDTTSDVAKFSGATTNQPSLSGARSVKAVDFSTGGWTLGGAGSLTLGGTGWNGTSIVSWSGSNIVNANLGELTGRLYAIAGSTLTFNGSVTSSGSIPCFAQTGSSIEFTGVVTTGAANSFYTGWDGNGTVRLSGTASNNIARLEVRDSNLELNKTGGAKAINLAAGTEMNPNGSGTLRWLQDNQFANSVVIKAHGNTRFDLNGHTETFQRLYGSFNGGTLTITLGGGTLNFNGAITAPVLWNHWDGAPSTMMTISGGTINLMTSGDFSPRQPTLGAPIALDISATITAGAGVASISVGKGDTGRFQDEGRDGTTRFSAPAGNSYAKDTYVTNAATLVVSNTSGSATGTGNVYVQNASPTLLTSKATLAGTGIIVPGAGKAVYVQNKGVLSPGFGTTDAEKKGLLSVIGDVAFQAGSFFNVDFGAGTSDTLAVSGLLNLGTTTLNLTQVGTPSYYPPFTIYTLATYGTLAGSFGTINGLPAGAVLTTDGGSIRLTVPEPVALALFALGALGLLGRRRKA